MSNILKPGEHLVKIVAVDKGVSEVKGIAYFAIRFMNQKGYIDLRLYHNEVTIKFAAKLFNAVQVKFNTKKDWAPQLEGLINKYLIITVTQAQREKDGTKFNYSNVYKYESVQKRYKYYSEEQPSNFSYFNSANFQFINRNAAGEESIVLPLRKYFIEYEEAHDYVIKKTEELKRNTSKPGLINLFSTDHLKGLGEKIIMSVNGSQIKYYNGYKGGRR